MDTNATVGIVGTIASFGLESYHTVIASLAAVATLAYMCVSIYYKIKESRKK